MDVCLEKFFPSVYRKMHQNCRLVPSFFASSVTRKFGRKVSMLSGGITFLIGAAINGAAMNVAMLIVGRILPGSGVGFDNQNRVVLFYTFFMVLVSSGFLDIVFLLNVVMQHAVRSSVLGGDGTGQAERSLSIGFQLFIAVDIFSANFITDYGWRV
ncbi:hypothetical protein EJ110_NYTH04687 [Nymphaea thermarum]|nr:hypothetical protein EJ110_NYTH04687 [Nymphaea thermarum]